MQDVPRKTVMVIEDDPDMFFMLNRALSDAGYRVITTRTEFENAGSSATPDIILLDRNCPISESIAVCKLLQINNKTRVIPILLISVYPMAKKAKAIGVKEFIAKPFDLSLLLNAIHKWTDSQYPAQQPIREGRRSKGPSPGGRREPAIVSEH